MDQQKCREEIESILKDEAPTIENLNELKYLEMCIFEAMRLFPTVPLFMRQLGENVQFGDFKVPKNSTIMIFPYYAHRHVKTFKDAEKFDPLRFSREEKLNPYAFLSFANGPR